MDGEFFNDNPNGMKYYSNYKMGVMEGEYKMVDKEKKCLIIDYFNLKH